MKLNWWWWPEILNMASGGTGRRQTAMMRLIIIPLSIGIMFKWFEMRWRKSRLGGSQQSPRLDDSEIVETTLRTPEDEPSEGGGGDGGGGGDCGGGRGGEGGGGGGFETDIISSSVSPSQDPPEIGKNNLPTNRFPFESSKLSTTILDDFRRFSANIEEAVTAAKSSDQDQKSTIERREQSASTNQELIEKPSFETKSVASSPDRSDADVTTTSTTKQASKPDDSINIDLANEKPVDNCAKCLKKSSPPPQPSGITAAQQAALKQANLIAPRARMLRSKNDNLICKLLLDRTRQYMREDDHHRHIYRSNSRPTSSPQSEPPLPSSS